MDSFNVHYGVAVRRPQPLVKLVYESNPASPSWVQRLMSRNPNSLANRIRRGEMKSAWDGIDDPFGPEARRALNEGQETVAERQKRIEEVNRRQDEINARLAAERHEKALDELQDVEGYGSF